MLALLVPLDAGDRDHLLAFPHALTEDVQECLLVGLALDAQALEPEGRAELEHFIHDLGRREAFALGQPQIPNAVRVGRDDGHSGEIVVLLLADRGIYEAETVNIGRDFFVIPEPVRLEVLFVVRDDLVLVLVREKVGSHRSALGLQECLGEAFREEKASIASDCFFINK